MTQNYPTNVAEWWWPWCWCWWWWFKWCAQRERGLRRLLGTNGRPGNVHLRPDCNRLSCKMQNVILLQKEKGKSALTVCARHTWAWNKLLVYTCVDHCKIQYLCNALKNSFELGRIMHSHAVQIVHMGTGLGAGAPCTPWRRIPNYAIISSRKFSGTTVQN